MRRLSAAGVLLAAAAAVSPTPPALAGPLDESLRLSGSIGLTAKANRERVATNLDNEGYSTYNTLFFRLNADFEIADRATILTEFFAPGGQRVGVYGAYVRFRDIAGAGFSVQAGKLPSLFGGYSQRGAYGTARPLIGLPLMYQYHTNLAADRVPGGAEGLLALKRERRSMIRDGAGDGANVLYLPLLYERCWDTGIEVFTETERLEVAAGVTTGTLSNPLEEDRNSGKQFVGRVALLAGPGARLGLSAAHGPYLNECATCYGGSVLGDSLAAHGFDLDDFGELSLGADFEWGMRHVRLYAEAVTKRWESPYVSDDLVATGYHVETRYTIVPGLYAAVAYGEILFGNVTRDDGTHARWDNSIRRVEAGGGYFITRQVIVRASVQDNDLYGFDDDDVEGPLLALQLEAGF